MSYNYETQEVSLVRNLMFDCIKSVTVTTKQAVKKQSLPEIYDELGIDVL